MNDLNDFYYFAKVVEHGGFSAAGQALNIPKSRLSRRIGELEQSYNIRLLQRSSRHFSVTEAGQEFYRHCVAVLVEAEAAREVMERKLSEPQGVIRMSCPTTLLAYRVAPLVADFMLKYPKVQIHIDATNRRVDVLGEHLDLALRVRFPPLDDSGLIMRTLGESRQRLVVHPDLLRYAKGGMSLEELTRLPTLDWGPPRDHLWTLIGPDNQTMELRHKPRYITDDMSALHQAALRGVGLVQLPCMVVEDDLREGRLLDAMPGWAPQSGLVHAVFPSRRGLLPSIRLFIDYLAQHWQQAMNRGNPT